MSHAESLPSSRPIPVSFNTQEIDLGELLASLWRQKYLIAGITLAATAMAALYAYTATPQYQTKTLLRPPSIKDLDALNQTGVYTLNPEESLRRVGAALNSYEVRKSYFDKHQEQFSGIDSGDLTQAFERFNSEAFKLIQSNPKGGDNLTTFVGLEITYPGTVEGHVILNGIVQEAIKSERKQIQDDLDSVIDNSLNTLERKMGIARASYEADKDSTIAKISESDALKRAQLQDELRALRTELRDRRESRITQLNESIQIARELGIVKPTTPTAMGQVDGVSQGNVFVRKSSTISSRCTSWALKLLGPSEMPCWHESLMTMPALGSPRSKKSFSFWIKIDRSNNLNRVKTTIYSSPRWLI